MENESSKEHQSVHDFTVKDVRGKDVELSQYSGKVLVVVNVASQCGLTNLNYTELNQLYEKYKDKGVEILAFPCNQFAGQEPGTNEQIEYMACTRFKAEFPIFAKLNQYDPKWDLSYLCTQCISSLGRWPNSHDEGH